MVSKQGRCVVSNAFREPARRRDVHARIEGLHARSAASVRIFLASTMPLDVRARAPAMPRVWMARHHRAPHHEADRSMRRPKIIAIERRKIVRLGITGSTVYRFYLTIAFGDETRKLTVSPSIVIWLKSSPKAPRRISRAHQS
jgi:hypothetical protein